MADSPFTVTRAGNTLPNASIWAAAQALYSNEGGLDLLKASDSTRNAFIVQAQEALDAAYSSLIGYALRDAAAKLNIIATNIEAANK